jgi:hypothetical protein
VFEGVTLEDGVFVGPHVCFTNDLLPRAITPDGKLKSADDWECCVSQSRTHTKVSQSRTPMLTIALNRIWVSGHFRFG